MTYLSILLYVLGVVMADDFFASMKDHPILKEFSPGVKRWSLLVCALSWPLCSLFVILRKKKRKHA